MVGLTFWRSCCCKTLTQPAWCFLVSILQPLLWKVNSRFSQAILIFITLFSSCLESSCWQNSFGHTCLWDSWSQHLEKDGFGECFISFGDALSLFCFSCAWKTILWEWRVNLRRIGLLIAIVCYAWRGYDLWHLLLQRIQRSRDEDKRNNEFYSQKVWFSFCFSNLVLVLYY